MKKFFFVIIFLVFALTTIYSQDISELISAKIAPEFLSEIIKQKPEYASLKSSSVILGEKAIVYSKEKDLYKSVIRIKKNSIPKNLPVQINSSSQNFATARLSIDDMIKLAENEDVIYIYPGEVFYPTNDVTGGLIGSDLVHGGFINNTPYMGTDIIVLVIDTGIDWDHLDFRDLGDNTKSRILFIWDQTDNTGGGTPEDRDAINFSGLNYGVEYTNEEINGEIDGTNVGVVWEEDTNGHGTHVSGSAAGNGASIPGTQKYLGVAPASDIVFVKAGNGSFSTADLLNALQYAKAIANTTLKPVVVNLSIGGHSNAHDGTRDLDEKVDEFTSSGAGRVAVISAGNDGGNAIHISVSVNPGNTTSITFSVPVYTANVGTDNDYFGFDLWCNNSDDVTATVLSPNGDSLRQTVNTSGTGQTNDGYIYLYNNISPDHTNGDRRIYTRVYDGVAAHPPASGTWTLKIINNSAAQMTYHGWLFTKTMGVTLNGGDKNYTVASPGTALSAITVGSYVSRWRWHTSGGANVFYTGTDYSDDISSFSSIGPTRDGRQKPEITSPGQGIISCTSTDASPSAGNIIDPYYHLNQGTSMASPICAGAVALMLDYNPTLTAAQIKDYLINSSVTDSYTGGALPDYTWGYGKLNVFNAIGNIYSGAASTFQNLFAYDTWTSSAEETVVKNEKIAIRFTPTNTGEVTGAFFHPSSTVSLTGPINFAIFSDNGGLPDALLNGSFVSVEPSQISVYSWNYVDLSSLNVPVNAGTDYHIVLSNSFGNDFSVFYDNNSIDNRSSKYEAALVVGYEWNAFSTGDFRLRTVVSTNQSLLPVELISFTAAPINDGVLLEWQTSTEVNNFGFQVQRTIINSKLKIKNWEDVGFVQGSGNANSSKSYSFTDATPPSGMVQYRLKQIDNDGKYNYSDIVEVNVETPTQFALEQNYPNPFNPTTTIKYSVPKIINHKSSIINLKIYDILGNEVATLVNENKAPGNYEVNFDGSNLSSGVYFYRLETGSFTSVKKLMLIK